MYFMNAKKLCLFRQIMTKSAIETKGLLDLRHSWAPNLSEIRDIIKPTFIPYVIRTFHFTNSVGRFWGAH